MTRPRARYGIRDKWASHPMLKEKVHTGTETIRRAYCAGHERETTAFEGVNSKGWIFRCKGAKGEPDTAHLFVAEPGDTND